MTIDRRGPTVKVRDDKRGVIIRFPGNWFGSTTDIELDIGTNEFDAFIAALGKARENMLERPPRDFEAKGEVHGTIDPRWQVQKQAGTGTPVMSLRHEGFGWLHFAIPKAEAEKLGHALLLQASDQTKPN